MFRPADSFKPYLPYHLHVVIAGIFIFAMNAHAQLPNGIEQTATALQLEKTQYDVVVYGATPAGITAAIQLAKWNHSVIVLEPSRHLGGMTTGGLGATDIGNKGVIGGMSREFYARIAEAYRHPSLWIFEKADDYKSSRQQTNEQTMWTFEPHVALQVFQSWLDEAQVEYRLDAKLDRSRKLELQDGRIQSIRLMNGQDIRARYFVDATYEGDLLDLAGVSHTVGRESNAAYNETLNGVQTKNAIKHQLFPRVSAFKTPGDPTSGLLPWVSSNAPATDGSADSHVQAYCLRMCLTNDDRSRIPFQKPEGYHESDYELLLRNFEAGLNELPWHSIMMPNHKTDTNNNTGFSTDMIGMSHSWPTSSYDERDELYQQHLRYQQGLMWTVANHPRVPEAIRRQASQWGSSRDEFIATNGWSPQLYVREARRMISDVVMTEHHCRGKELVHDSVGMAAYTMDSHNVQRYVDTQGNTRNEGDVQVGGFPPYPISYRSIIPKRGECSNLAVPVCLSSSHIAFGSIRMEPVYMILGQSSAAAIHLALAESGDLQDVPYDRLLPVMRELSQVLSWETRIP
jgi:FAD dependent oxidoreductase